MNAARAGRPFRSFGMADPHRTPGLVVHVNYAIPRRGLPASVSFKRWIEATLFAARHREPAELSIRIVDAREGRMLNRQYRDKEYATNVLSFPVEIAARHRLAAAGRSRDLRAGGRPRGTGTRQGAARSLRTPDRPWRPAPAGFRSSGRHRSRPDGKTRNRHPCQARRARSLLTARHLRCRRASARIENPPLPGT